MSRTRGMNGSAGITTKSEAVHLDRKGERHPGEGEAGQTIVECCSVRLTHYAKTPPNFGVLSVGLRKEGEPTYFWEESPRIRRTEVRPTRSRRAISALAAPARCSFRISAV